MKKRRILILCLSLCLFGLMACGQQKQETMLITAFDQEGPHDTIAKIKIEATSHFVSPALKHEEVARQLEELLRSGRYDTIMVRSHYRDEYLDSIEVLYRVNSLGKGKMIRASIIQSYEKSREKKSEDIKSRIDHLLSSGGLDIVKIQTLMISEMPLAAEIYFRKS